MNGVQGVSNQCDPGEQTQQQRGGACNRLVRPLTLRFQTQMATGFLSPFHKLNRSC